MDDSWNRGKRNIEFINLSEQQADEGNDIYFEQLVFNFCKKWLKNAQANAKDIDLSLSLMARSANESEEEQQTFKCLIEHIMLCEENMRAFQHALDKVYTFGQSVLHVRNVREDEKTLNEKLVIESVEDPTTCFFDPESARHDFSDGTYCGRFFRLPKETIQRLYPKLQDLSLNKTCEVIDFWHKDKKQVNFVKLSGGEYKREDLVDDLRDNVIFGEAPKKAYVTTMTYVRCLKNHKDFLEKQQNLKFTRLPLIFNGGDIEWNQSENKYETIPLGYDWHDPQIFLNYVGSLLADIAKSTKADRWLVNPEHLQSPDAENSLAEINTRQGGMVFTGNLSTIRREVSQQIPGDAVALFTQLSSLIENLAGAYFDNNSSQVKAYSGVALDKLFNRIDLIQNSFITAHMAAINLVGRTLQEMIPSYYWQERLICTQNSAGSIQRFVINEADPQPNAPTQKKNNIKDIQNKYDYQIKIVPSKRLQKQNTNTELTQVYQIYPQAVPLTIDLFVQSLDIPNAEIIAKRLGANIPKELIEYGNGVLTYNQFQQKMKEKQAETQQTQAQMMQNSPQAKLAQAQVVRDQANAQKATSDAQTAAFRAETERAKAQVEGVNDHISTLTDAAKVEMENENTKAHHQLEMIKTLATTLLNKDKENTDLTL